MRAKPQPKGSIPIWIGGHADVALKRASKSGMDGMELFINRKDRRTNTKLSNFKLRDNFVFSMRTSWDPLEDDQSQIASEIKEYMRVGVTHLFPNLDREQLKTI